VACTRGQENAGCALQGQRPGAAAERVIGPDEELLTWLFGGSTTVGRSPQAAARSYFSLVMICTPERKL